MPSSLSWMAYSEQERRRAMEVIDLFKEQDTRDELGIGSIRDALSNLFFPGTSTIQTRARYFLFIPWIYLDLEKSNSRSNIATRARNTELALIDALAESDDRESIIGIEARRALKRLPSMVYWQGLGRWRIRLFPGSQDQYHRHLQNFQTRTRWDRLLRTDDGEPVEGALPRNWHAGLPPKPDDFPARASFRLTPEEAEYLRERILSAAPGTLLAFLVDRGRPFDPVPFPWEHPQVGELPARIRRQLLDAQHFSTLMHGAALLYNLMVAELLEGEEELAEDYRAWLAEWAEGIAGQAPVLAEWDRNRFWQMLTRAGARIPVPTHEFVEGWFRLVLDGGDPEQGARRVVESTAARELIRQRERALKGPLARLENRRARELWSGASGTAPLDYRWRSAQRIIGDILVGLHGGDSRA